MAQKHLAVIQPDRPFSTLRTDAWWKEPLMVVVVLGGFGLYATWAALQNAHYFVDPYLSPFYSPCVATTCKEVSLPLVGTWWPKWASPAFLILWIPGGFRATCYYYRKAYYRSFFGMPPACAVRDVPSTYTGETRFPLLLQNLHRYFFYFSVAVVAFLWWDAIRGFHFKDGWGVGLGSLVLLMNATLLSLYTFSCHSCRHLFAGHVDVFSKARARWRIFRTLSKLNERHMAFAWVSLFGVALSDAYVRLLSMGYFHDIRFF